MLKQRIITAVILAPLAVWAVLAMPQDYFSLTIALITLLAAWEWLGLINITSPLKRSLFMVALILPILTLHFWTQLLELIAVVFDWTDVRSYSGIVEWLVVPPILFWIITMLLIRKNPEALLNLELKPRNKALIGWMILLATWMFLTRLRALYTPEMTLYFLLLIWAADISAYFVGKKWGTTKLSPDISPGKTLAGVYGALAASIVCGVALSLFYNFAFIFASDFTLLSVLTVLVSIYGDLFFSLVKRQSGVKDSGALLPGHGGILDRIDSLIAAIPLFYAGVYLIYRAVP